jgi:hypothetical protein
VLGTRRTVVTRDDGGYYGNDKFRFAHHEKIKPFVQPGMEVFYEVVGYTTDGRTIMPNCDNKKLKDKDFVKRFGETTEFSYGCEVGQSEMYVYRITGADGEEYTPEQIMQWCAYAGVFAAPLIFNHLVFTDWADLMAIINKFCIEEKDLIGDHIMEGVVVRINNRPGFVAFKYKTMTFKILEGIIKEAADAPDMEEAEELDE